MKPNWKTASVYGSRCIPLDWCVYLANRADAYPAEGQMQMTLALLRAVQAGLPALLSVRLSADWGIGTSSDLMIDVMQMGWHFLFRVTKQSKIILSTGEDVTFYAQITTAGQQYQASSVVFKQRGRNPAHICALWGEGAHEP